MSNESPVACCLSDEELRNREATLLALFKAAVIESEELDNGYLFRVRGDNKSIALVTELIIAERECCPFLKFELSLEPAMGPLSVRMTGPAGTKEFLKSILT
jgi:hypothetical protein